MEQLPQTVFAHLLQHILNLDGANPATAIKLSLASKQLLALVYSSDGLWEGLCVKQGWR